MSQGKKLLSAVLVLLLLMGATVGCGAKNTSETSSKEEATTTSPVEDAEPADEQGTDKTTDEIAGKLVIWEHGANFEDPLLEVIDSFQAKYPAVEIEHEIKSDNYYNLLTTSIQAGEAPDLFWTNGTSTTEMYNFVEQDVLMDLTDAIDFSDLEEDSLSIGNIDDVQYSIPWMSYDTRAVYYNKTMFEELGLTVPTTFSEFEALLPKIKEAGKIPISLSGMDSWALLFFFEPLLAAHQPEYTRGLADYSSKADDPRVGEALNKALEWADLGYFGDGYLGVDGDGQSLAFTMGESAMTVSGSWMIQSFMENNPDLDFGAFQMPAEDGTTGMVGSFANGFSVYNHTQYPEAALAFAQHCATLESQEIWVNRLGAVSGSPNIASANPIAQEVADAEERYTSWQAVLANYNKEGMSATSIWDEDSTKIFSRSISVEDFLASIGEAMQ